MASFRARIARKYGSLLYSYFSCVYKVPLRVRIIIVGIKSEYNSDEIHI